MRRFRAVHRRALDGEVCDWWGSGDGALGAGRRPPVFDGVLL